LADVSNKANEAIQAILEPIYNMRKKVVAESGGGSIKTKHLQSVSNAYETWSI
jgi:hypothetical protein